MATVIARYEHFVFALSSHSSRFNQCALYIVYCIASRACLFIIFAILFAADEKTTTIQFADLTSIKGNFEVKRLNKRSPAAEK